MILKKVKIYNYRQLQKVELDLQNSLTVLTDANRTLSQSVWSYPPKTIANTVEEVSLQSLCVEGCMTSNNYCTRQTFYNSASV